MKDIPTFGNEDILRTGEELLSPAAKRWEVLKHAIGDATVSMAPLGVLDQPLETMVEAQVDDIFMDRRRQQLGMQPSAAQPVAPIESIVEMDNTEYIDRLASKPDTAQITEISPAARTTVMNSTVDFTNGFQEAA